MLQLKSFIAHLISFLPVIYFYNNSCDDISTADNISGQQERSAEVPRAQRLRGDGLHQERSETEKRTQS